MRWRIKHERTRHSPSFLIIFYRFDFSRFFADSFKSLIDTNDPFVDGPATADNSIKDERYLKRSERYIPRMLIH
jgi:hypothetical protein